MRTRLYAIRSAKTMRKDKMNLCKDCRYFDVKGRDADAPMLTAYPVCMKPDELIDPVLGQPLPRVSCREQRMFVPSRFEKYCSPAGTWFEEKI